MNQFNAFMKSGIAQAQPFTLASIKAHMSEDGSAAEAWARVSADVAKKIEEGEAQPCPVKFYGLEKDLAWLMKVGALYRKMEAAA